MSPIERLGCKQGWSFVKMHPFFNGIDFSQIRVLPCPDYNIPAIPLTPFPSVLDSIPIPDPEEVKTAILNVRSIKQDSISSHPSALWYSKFLIGSETIVFSELVRSMSEFTPSVIGTESRVHVLFAQFQFLFYRVGSHMSSGSLIVIVGAIGVVSGVGVL